MKQHRTSKKQVQNILDCFSTKESKLELIPHDYCGKYKYSICKYCRKPKLVDRWGYVYSYTEWKWEEALIRDSTLKEAYAFASGLLDKWLEEQMNNK